VTSAHFEWNYTTFLNILFILLAVAVYWFSKNKKRFGGGEGYAIDPSCGMQVRISDAPATAVIDGTTHYFCSDRCHDLHLGSQGRAAEQNGDAHCSEGIASIDHYRHRSRLWDDRGDDSCSATRNHDGATSVDEDST
jgi:YHS domain-containing protein